MDTQYFKDKLEKEKVLLHTELADLGRIVNKETGDWEPVPPETVEESDENDLADKFEEYENKSAMLETLEPKLREVEKALEKIEKGTYGTCEICGKEIEHDRLEANPSAKTCIEHRGE
jgi:RNA polymerase-binding transcription factor DksA